MHYKLTSLLSLAGVLGTCLGFSARIQAQEGIPGRVDREKLAPQVMSSPTSSRGSIRFDPNAVEQELTIFNESVKRLRKVERDDPTRALAEYRKFLVGVNPTAVVGVQAALKVSQLRQTIKDIPGALRTCEVFAHKYAMEPSSSLLALQKAQILSSEKQWASSVQVIEDAMPNLLQMGPRSFDSTAHSLLVMAKIVLANGDKDRKTQALRHYVLVEQIYLYWLKKQTVDHLWERLATLRTDYQNIGETERAETFFDKVGDAISKIPVNKDNRECGVVALELARWLSQEDKFDQAALYYKRAASYGNETINEMVLLDEAQQMLWSGDYTGGCRTLETLTSSTSVETRAAAFTILSRQCYYHGDLMGARKAAEAVIVGRTAKSGHTNDEYFDDSSKLLMKVEAWQREPIHLEMSQLTVKQTSHENAPCIVRFKVWTYQNIPLEVKSNSASVKTHLTSNQSWNGQTNKSADGAFEREVVVEISSDVLVEIGNRIGTLSVSAPSIEGSRKDIDLVRTIE